MTYVMKMNVAVGEQDPVSSLFAPSPFPRIGTVWPLRGDIDDDEEDGSEVELDEEEDDELDEDGSEFEEDDDEWDEDGEEADNEEEDDEQ